MTTSRPTPDPPLVASRHPLLGIASNHVQAIREALCCTIGGEALATFVDHEIASADVALTGSIGAEKHDELTKRGVAKWLVAQGLENPGTADSTDSAVSIVFSAVRSYRYQARDGVAATFDHISSSRMNPDAKSIGVERSASGWNRAATFCIGAAFVQVLGALDQFELDVVKALLYYRPFGVSGPADEYEDKLVDLDVVTEKPTKRPNKGKKEKKEKKEYYTKPPLWTWIRPRAERVDSRREILKHVFDIETIEETKGWRNKRNKIAHGRPIEVKLKEYLDVEAYVTKSMLHLAVQCKAKQRLIV